jgi:hypothetical protein
LQGTKAEAKMSRLEIVESIIAMTEPLAYPRGERLPLYLWPLTDIDTGDDAESEQIIADLDARGMAVVSTWNHDDTEASLERALRIGGIQKKLGIGINISATLLMHRFCNGDPETAHITDSGDRFFDPSFSKSVDMGCPFALRHRYDEIRDRIASFAKAYRDRDLEVGFIFADWEIDGPIEWNGAWESSRRCARCRQNIPDIENFTAFQNALREIRSDIQKKTYADVMRSYFPNVLVGNYAVYPHNGCRYWYDFFEKFVEGAPHVKDQRAIYRKWSHEFDDTGYTYAMPVVYTWHPTFSWYDFKNPDYHWFYNMLLVASNAGANTPGDIPIISFMHWNTTDPPADPDLAVPQLSKEIYQELLWHMLLRGHDTFFLWCPLDESVEETLLLHEVYAEALAYRDYLDKGRPITFAVPASDGPVVSGLRLGNRVLARRTDFTDRSDTLVVAVDEQEISVPRSLGLCQILDVE